MIIKYTEYIIADPPTTPWSHHSQPLRHHFLWADRSAFASFQVPAPCRDCIAHPQHQWEVPVRTEGTVYQEDSVHGWPSCGLCTFFSTESAREVPTGHITPGPTLGTFFWGKVTLSSQCLLSRRKCSMLPSDGRATNHHPRR